MRSERVVVGESSSPIRCCCFRVLRVCLGSGFWCFWFFGFWGFLVMANFVNVGNVNTRLDSVNDVSSVLGRALADDTMLIRMFGDIDSGFVNPGVTGGSTVLFKTSAEMLSGATEFSYGIHNTPIVRDLCAAVSLLDESEFSMLTPSGLSALTSVVVALVKPGDHVLIVDTAYEPLREFCC